MHIKKREKSSEESATHGKIAVKVEHSWTLITVLLCFIKPILGNQCTVPELLNERAKVTATNSARQVTHTIARRMGNLAKAFFLFKTRFCWSFLFSSITPPSAWGGGFFWLNWCTKFTFRAVPSPIQTWKVHVALYRRFEKLWHFVTFCDISKCHKVTLLNFVTFLGFCHTVCIFLVFFSKT